MTPREQLLTPLGSNVRPRHDTTNSSSLVAGRRDPAAQHLSSRCQSDWSARTLTKAGIDPLGLQLQRYGWTGGWFAHRRSSSVRH